MKFSPFVEEFGLCSTETDHASRLVHLRYAPLVAGIPDRASPFLQHVTLMDLPLLPDPGDEPASPPVAGEDVDAHAKAVEGWLVTRREWAARRDAAVASRAGQSFTRWLDDPRPDHVKAEDHFRRARGMAPEGGA